MSTEAKTAASRTKFPNKTDFALWQAMQPAPQWAKRFASGASPNIDDVVNSHVVSSDSDFARRGRDCDAHNLVGFVRGAMTRGGIKEALVTLDMCGADTNARFKGRAAMARRWATRIRETG